MTEKARTRRVARMQAARLNVVRPSGVLGGLKTKRGKLARIRRMLAQAGFAIEIREFFPRPEIRRYLLRSIEPQASPPLKARGAALGGS